MVLRIVPAACEPDFPPPAVPARRSDATACLGIVRFLSEAADTPTLLHRAVASLGILPEVAWTELRSVPQHRADVWVRLGTQSLCVGLIDPGCSSAHGFLKELLGTIAALFETTRRIDALRADACTDPLTSLWNRRGFLPFLEQAVARYRRTGEEIALALFDVDHFKAINDTHGHAAGDQALRTVALALQACTRPTDMAARLGGDELALLLAGANATGARIVAERVRENLARANPMTLGLTLSVGISDVSGLDFEAKCARTEAGATLLCAADCALYRAKTMGRDRIECFGPASSETWRDVG